MKRCKLLKVLTPIMVLSLMLTGCGSKEVTDVKKNSDISVTLVLDKGGVNDGSFNESAWLGAEKAINELGVKVDYLESNTDADYIQNIETAIDLGSDLVIGVGFNLSDAIGEAARSYPDVDFAIVDGSYETIPDNVTPILFDESEAGYLAGLVTAKTLVDTDKYGFVGGFELPAVVSYKDGFEKGLKEVNPEADLSVIYANSFSDASKGRVIAEQFISDGIGCIMSAAGGVNNGVYEVCKEKGKYAVAVDMAQSNVAPDVIVTSAIKKVDKGVFESIRSYVDGKLKGGVNVTYTEGVGYEKTNLLSDEAIEYVESKNN